MIEASALYPSTHKKYDVSLVGFVRKNRFALFFRENALFPQFEVFLFRDLKIISKISKLADDNRLLTVLIN